tara:strand:- start:795 stop:1040 length:246 start_codon:yes stop_codon:yes gene_type:complete
METLNKRVETLFLDKHKYRDIDYIRIMNELKETYLKLKGTKEEPKRETFSSLESDNESDNESEESDLDYDSDGYENYYSSY